MDAITGNELMVERLGNFLRENVPSLDDIVGAVCELYRVDPDELPLTRDATPARSAVCYIAVRFACVSNAAIGRRIGFDVVQVNRTFKNYTNNLTNPLVRDDLDLIGIRIAERVLLRRRMLQ
jgi:hypothetical protein